MLIFDTETNTWSLLCNECKKDVHAQPSDIILIANNPIICKTCNKEKNAMPSEQPAFPIPSQYEPGMSLRDYFAAKAMQGLSANSKLATWDEKEVAEFAYKQADAMLAVRDKK